MQILIGALLGYVAGVAVWLTTHYFVRRSWAAPPEGRSLPGLLLLWDEQGAISIPAVLVQTGMALWGAYAGWRVTGLDQVVAAVLVTGLLLAISLVDFQTRRIPNPLVLALLAWALVQVLWLGQPALDAALLGLLVGGGLFLLLALLGRGAMGAGDVKLAAALGAILGYPLVFSGLLWGVVAGGAAALFLLLTRRAGRKDTMAYGPYLALGAWIIWTRFFGLWP